MKKCNVCDTYVDEQAKFCPSCGSVELVDVDNQQQAQQQQNSDLGQYPPISRTECRE